MTPHLVIFGAQGSGKGTQAKRLVERLGVIYIGLGDILREISQEKSPFGSRVFETVKAGQLVPNELVDQLVSQKVGDLPPSVGFILDGYPRNQAQADALRHTLTGLSRLNPPPVFINLEVPEPELLARLAKRRETEGRHDDTEETIAERLDIYERETKPALDSIAQWATLLHINGNQPVDTVTEEIISKLDD